MTDDGDGDCGLATREELVEMINMLKDCVASVKPQKQNETPAFKSKAVGKGKVS